MSQFVFLSGLLMRCCPLQGATLFARCWECLGCLEISATWQSEFQFGLTWKAGSWRKVSPRRHFNYLEIGTSDFDTLLERHVWRDDIHGISVEPLRSYFELLPGGTGSSKVLLNVAISDHDGYENLYFVRPELVEVGIWVQSVPSVEDFLFFGA